MFVNLKMEIAVDSEVTKFADCIKLFKWGAGIVKNLKIFSSNWVNKHENAAAHNTSVTTSAMAAHMLPGQV